MDVFEAILRRRSIRQFEPRPVERKILEKIVEAGRLAPSAANLQPLEFLVVEAEDVRAAIFPLTKWAAYISPEGNPKPGREPQAYVFILVNTGVRDQGYEFDVGAAMENMALAAQGEGLASCWLISFDKPKAAEVLGVPSTHNIASVLALGYPAETSSVEAYRDSPRYWKDEAGGFHVPKRRLADILHFNAFKTSSSGR
ncbi:MAG: nitroreductase [Candidatus Aminicenantes bacterium]|nr:nitroreductase [Candidatus Aminicenantes bacterium]